MTPNEFPPSPPGGIPFKEYTLYFSNFDTYESCPQKFLWSRGWYDIDLGYGMGKKRPPPVKSSEHDRLMGEIIQKAVEDMYNKELWKDPATLQDKLADIVRKEFYHKMQKSYIDWNRAPTQHDMLDTCHAGVTGYLKTMRHNKLLGVFNKAEMEFVCRTDKDTSIGGKADLVVRRSDTGVIILDGKNSKTRGKYTVPDQLRWYALCYWLCFDAMPDRLAFVYYRYPYGTPVLNEFGNPTGEVESGLVDVSFTKEDLEGLALRTIDVHKGMREHKFEPNPEPSRCKFCDFETVCEARQSTKRKRNAKKTTLEQQVIDGGGLIEL